MPSKNQRAVTGVPDERWKRLGVMLTDWREEILGYRYRTVFARERGIHSRFAQELENSDRPGEYTRWSLRNAARAYGVTYESILAVLAGQADSLTPAADGNPAGKLRRVS